MLQLLFAMKLDWLPLRGRPRARASPRRRRVTGFYRVDSLIAGRFDAFRDALRHLVLPAVHAVARRASPPSPRFTRAGVLDTLQKDFVTYERAQGYPPRCA